jgi:hypothetical protein
MIRILNLIRISDSRVDNAGVACIIISVFIKMKHPPVARSDRYWSCDLMEALLIILPKESEGQPRTYRQETHLYLFSWSLSS